MSEIVVCQNCGAKNRVVNRDKEARCGSCWSLLYEKEYQERNLFTIILSWMKDMLENIFASIRLIVIALLVALIFLITLGYFKLNQDPLTTLKKLKESLTYTEANTGTIEKVKPKENNYPVVPLPVSGDEKNFIRDACVAPLTIDTSSGVHYLVKIVDGFTKKIIMTIFIRGGGTVTTKVPLGTYELRYASGKQWYGYTHLFGVNTLYSKADKLFRFEKSGNRITGYSITLYRVSNGNLTTSYLNPSEF